MILYPQTPEQTEAICRWVASRIELPVDFSGARALAVERQGRVVAGVVYDHYRPPQIEMSIAATSPAWATPSTVVSLLLYAFAIPNIARITALVEPSNKRCRRFLEGVNFKLEGSLAAGGGNGKPILLYGLTHQRLVNSRLNNGQEIGRHGHSADTAGRRKSA